MRYWGDLEAMQARANLAVAQEEGHHYACLRRRCHAAGSFSGQRCAHSNHQGEVHVFTEHGRAFLQRGQALIWRRGVQARDVLLDGLNRLQPRAPM